MSAIKGDLGVLCVTLTVCMLSSTHTHVLKLCVYTLKHTHIRVENMRAGPHPSMMVVHLLIHSQDEKEDSEDSH